MRVHARHNERHDDDDKEEEEEIYLTIIAMAFLHVAVKPAGAYLRINAMRHAPRLPENHCVARSVFTMFTQPPHMSVRYIAFCTTTCCAISHVCMHVYAYNICITHTIPLFRLCRARKFTRSLIHAHTQREFISIDGEFCLPLYSEGYHRDASIRTIL